MERGPRQSVKLISMNLALYKVQPDQDQNPLLNLLMNQQSRLHNMDQ